MKTIKIGQINFPDNYGEYTLKHNIESLNNVSTSLKYEYEDCLTNECDIVFYSIYGHLNELKKIKGSPLLLYWTYEYKCCGPDEIFNDPFIYYKNNNPSISFYDDSNDNLFFPYFVLSIPMLCYVQGLNIKNYSKRNNFCTFCASNAYSYNAKFRTDLVKYISSNYKEITCCGSVLNNTNNEYLPRDYRLAALYHNDYKFNLCFENTTSTGNISYITEKIVNAYAYNVVPIYWGSDRINEWFNKESFINCNNLTYDQILNKIKEIDNDEEQYQYMLNQKPMNDDPVDVYAYFFKKLDKFIISKL